MGIVLVPAEVPVGALVRCVDVGVAVGVDLGSVAVVGAPVLVVGIVLVPAEVPVGALVRCVDVGVAVGAEMKICCTLINA